MAIREEVTFVCKRCGSRNHELKITDNGVMYVCKNCKTTYMERAGRLEIYNEYRAQRYIIRNEIERALDRGYEPQRCECGCKANKLKENFDLYSGYHYKCPKCRQVQYDEMSKECLDKLYALARAFPAETGRDPIYYFMFLQVLTKNFTRWNNKMVEYSTRIEKTPHDEEDKEEYEAYVESTKHLMEEMQGRIDRVKKKKKIRRKAIVSIVCIVLLVLGSIFAVYKINPVLLVGENTLKFIVDGKEYAQTNVSFMQNIKVDCPEKTGYVFLGYFDAEIGGNKVVDEEGHSVETWKDLGRDKTINLYARWQVKSYTFVLNAEGGRGENLDSFSVEYNGDIEDISADISYVGYDFLGWSLAPGSVADLITDENGVLVQTRKIFNENSYTLPEEGAIINLYAVWEGKSCEIAYDVNGGSPLSKSDATVIYGNSATLSVPSKVGYAFVGWYTDAVSGKQITGDDGILIAVWDKTEPVTLYAHWDIKKYDVEITRSNSIAGSVSGETSVEYLSQATFSVTTNAGFAWDGWYNANDVLITNETTYSFNMPANAVVLKAKWIPNKYTVTYNANGGAVTNLTEEVTFDEEYTLEVPTMTGYEFIGWFTSKTGGEQLTDNVGACFDNWDMAGNTTLYAHWQIKVYSVTATRSSSSAGTISFSSKEVKYNEAVSITAESNPGYIWDGWYRGDTLLTKNATYEFSMPAGNYYITARWTPYTYNFTFDLNGSSLKTTPSISSTTQTAKQDAPLLVPTCDYYKFKGWFTQKSGGAKIADSTGKLVMSFSNNENITVYAQWETNYTLESYTVSTSPNNCNDNNGYDASKPTNKDVDKNEVDPDMVDIVVGGTIKEGSSYRVMDSLTMGITVLQAENNIRITHYSTSTITRANISDDTYAGTIKNVSVPNNTRVGKGLLYVVVTYTDYTSSTGYATNLFANTVKGSYIDILGKTNITIDTAKKVKSVRVVVAYEIQGWWPGAFWSDYDTVTNWVIDKTISFI